MNVTVASSNPVPREYIGQARMLRRELDADDILAQQLIGRICLPYPSMIAAGGTPRPEMLARTAQAWRNLPATGRLLLEVELKKKSLVIRELRLMAANLSFDSWGDGEELGVLLAVHGLVISPGKFRYEPVKLCSIGIHALGRWYQRNFQNSRLNLLAALCRLGMAIDDTVLAEPGSINLFGWRGGVLQLTAENEFIVCIRTFAPT